MPFSQTKIIYICIQECNVISTNAFENSNPINSIITIQYNNIEIVHKRIFDHIKAIITLQTIHFKRIRE